VLVPPASAGSGLRLPPPDQVGAGLRLGGLDAALGFETWAVPAATVGGVGLLVLLFVALQAGVTIIWFPAVRRLRDDHRPRRVRGRRTGLM
jgi:hypothetical protein